MLMIKGIYEHGQVRLLEPVPPYIAEPQKVTVTFVEPQTEEDSSVTVQQVQAELNEATDAALALIGLLNTLSPEQLETFDSTLERRSPFFGPREMTW